MRAFYETKYPIDRVVALLTHNGQFPLGNVRFGFRWGEDCFKRYETFETKQDAIDYMDRMEYPTEEEIPSRKLPLRFFNKGTLRTYLMDNTPDTINVQFPENARPLVFDVDIGDFNAKREYCMCQSKQVCRVCWIEIMRPAMIQAKHFLVDFIGFKEVMFVFSGRKGFHIWVTDEKVWSFSLNARQNFVDRIGIPVDREITCGKGHLVKLPWGKHQATQHECCVIENIQTWNIP